VKFTRGPLRGQALGTHVLHAHGGRHLHVQRVPGQARVRFTWRDVDQTLTVVTEAADAPNILTITGET
jgi:hypothetical protein